MDSVIVLAVCWVSHSLAIWAHEGAHYLAARMIGLDASRPVVVFRYGMPWRGYVPVGGDTSSRGTPHMFGALFATSDYRGALKCMRSSPSAGSS